MALSRYRDSIVTGKRLSTFPYVKISEIEDDLNDVFIEFHDGDRIDTLAQKYLGDGRYWWIICAYNNLDNAFAITNGTILRIPTSPDAILRKIAEQENEK